MTFGSFRLGVRPTFRRIHISRFGRFVYYGIPKSANSTIVRTLIEMNPSIKILGGYDDVSAKREAHAHPFDVTLGDTFRIKKNYYAFTFVRNPYDRVLSAYLDKMRAGHKKIQKVRSRVAFSGEFPDFSDFVFYLEQGGLYDDIHWAPQHNLLPPFKKLDLIGRVENLESDLKEVTARIFPGIPYQGPVDSRSHATGASGKRYNYYTANLRKRIERLYRKDFKKYGYCWRE
ncbi:sulfotransferase family protein [Halorhodospira neutriphila]|uniref:Sulfotransferase family protein n=1 Tax=Halorhodospira neutriphila TaxID=168379 RepID=A0ABS1E334_9GAMM|nr:sulfotransferase family protein [Halorhodospira neutriphila]MBK1725627.1 hypothetical protein [Halorhodospira neutriphila]